MRKTPAARVGLTLAPDQALLNPPVTHHPFQLAYCTNIHPAETWEETFRALANHALPVRELLEINPLPGFLSPFPLAPRLSARAARELLTGDHLPRFRDWLTAHNAAVFTINGFPYGAFHGTRVKENVYRPDWSEPARLDYTRNLFRILAALLPPGAEGSVSTLPGSFKAFHADESAIIRNLITLAGEIETLSEQSGHDLHLGLEPEPLGLFENTAETIAFFQKLTAATPDPAILRRRIGLNYDTCHFAIEYDDCHNSLSALAAAGIRISKVHLSNALALDPRDPSAIRAIAAFDEMTYLHQVIARHADGSLTRFSDLPSALTSHESTGGGRTLPEGRTLPACSVPHPAERSSLDASLPLANSEAEAASTSPPADTSSPPSPFPISPEEWRVHFHIPLDAEPAAPLRSTRDHVLDLLAYRRAHPEFCHHFEIETYTWSVLPPGLQRPINAQLAAEYRWVLANL